MKTGWDRFFQEWGMTSILLKGGGLILANAPPMNLTKTVIPYHKTNIILCLKSGAKNGGVEILKWVYLMEGGVNQKGWGELLHLCLSV